MPARRGKLQVALNSPIVQLLDDHVGLMRGVEDVYVRHLTITISWLKVFLLQYTLIASAAPAHASPGMAAELGGSNLLY